MSKPAAPSMPTKRQVHEAHKAVTAVCPSARIKSVGPDGVEFDYPDRDALNEEWRGRPFGADQA